MEHKYKKIKKDKCVDVLFSCLPQIDAVIEKLDRLGFKYLADHMDEIASCIEDEIILLTENKDKSSKLDTHDE